MTSVGPTMRRQTRPQLVWLAPLTIVLLATFVYPAVEVVRLSFTDASLVGDEGGYTLDSYRFAFQDGFIQTITVTFAFVILSVIGQLVLGILLALLIDEAQRRSLRGVGVLRGTVLMSWAIPGVVIGVIWTMLLQENSGGVTNWALASIGVPGTPLSFLSDPTLALLSVVAANIWRGTALTMIFAYAGLQAVPQEVREAASIDGAGYVRTFFAVVRPIMGPILLVNLIIVIVETFNTFDMVLGLTGGGPGDATEFLALRIYREIFTNLNLGQGSALAVILLAINLVLVAVILGYTSLKERRNG